MPIANGASILLQDNDKGVTINPPNTYYGNSTVKFAVYGKSYFNNEVGIYEEPQSGKALYIVNPYGDIAIYAQDEVWYQSLHQITKSNDFKSNYGDLPNSLDKILALQTQSFTYQTDKYPNEDLPTDIQYEYSIDEFEKAFPELISRDSNDIALNTSALQPFIVEAIKEQQVIIESQSEQINNLQKQINELSVVIDNQILNTDNSNLINYSTPILYQNTPNPYTNQTSIKYSLPDNDSNSFIKIYNISGIEIQSIELQNQKGQNYITIDASNLESGIYAYTLIVNNQVVDTKTMVISKK